MKWHLYKPDDFNTYPKIDCPMVICFKNRHNNEMEFRICKKYVTGFGIFVFQDGGTYCTECYYAYIGYAPSGYKTCYPTKCMRECDDRCGFDDDGYCMSDETYACEYKRDIAEYSIEEKRIWKEFE